MRLRKQEHTIITEVIAQQKIDVGSTEFLCIV